MTADGFAHSLLRKSERAIRVARLCLESGDPDSAVNRAYYAMFNVARAALLKDGVPEGELPRTHRGLNEAFRNHAVLPGRIDSELAGALTRAENLRLKADYTASEIDAEAAADTVERAEKFIRAVERAFSLEGAASSKDSDQLRHNNPTEEPETTKSPPEHG